MIDCFQIFNTNELLSYVEECSDEYLNFGVWISVASVPHLYQFSLNEKNSDIRSKMNEDRFDDSWR